MVMSFSSISAAGYPLPKSPKVSPAKDFDPCRSPKETTIPLALSPPNWVSHQGRDAVIGSHATIMNGLNNCLTTGEFSDLKIMCENVEMLVHKNVVLSQSKPLKAMFSYNFKESEENIIRLEEDALNVVSSMLEYLYRSDYPELDHEKHFASLGANADGITAEAEFDELRLYHHIDVFVLADKYDISSLGDLAAGKFRKVLDDTWLGMRFLETIPIIYNSTADHNAGLRKAVAAHARSRWYMFNSAAEEEAKDRFEDLIATVPEFAVDFLRCWLKVGYNDLCSQCGEELDAAVNVCHDCSDGGYRQRARTHVCCDCGDLREGVEAATGLCCDCSAVRYPPRHE